MKVYSELNQEEKHQLEKLVNEVRELLPIDNNFFASEKIDSSDNKVLKTKQDYNEDKNQILKLIEEARKSGKIDKQKSKELKLAITILFNEFIRISPKKTLCLNDTFQKEDETREELLAIHKVNGTPMIMHVGELYTNIQGTFVKLPEKVLYKIMDIPGNQEMQSMQYFITNESEIKYIQNEENKMMK